MEIIESLKKDDMIEEKLASLALVELTKAHPNEIELGELTM